MTETVSPARRDLERALWGVVPEVKKLDLAAPDAASRLEQAVPFAGPVVARLKSLCAKGLAEGWLAPREGGPNVRFGRLAKAMGGFAVDVVVMEGKALGHTHVKGEVNLCLPLEGSPRFDGHPPGWVIFPPGSHHVPTVTGGKMLFVYFTPGGEVVWDKPA
jgi:hypothetical protein